MPTFRHGKNTRLLVDQYDLSTNFRQVQMNMQQDAPETTAFLAVVKSYVVGLPDGRLSLSGMYAADAGSGADAILSPMLNTSTPAVVSYLPEGAPGASLAGGASRRAYSMQGYLGNYQVQAAVADVVGMSADFVNAGTLGLRSGQLLMDGTATGGASFAIATNAYVSGSTTVAVIDRGAGADTTNALSGYVAIHLTNVAFTAGTSPTLTAVSVDSGTSTGLASKTAVTASPTIAVAGSGTYSAFLTFSATVVQRYVGIGLTTSGAPTAVALSGAITFTTV